MIKAVRNAFRKKREYVAAIVANLSIACMGASMAWTSPMEPKLTNLQESPLDTIPTASELSWIGSILTLGSLLGPISAGYIAQRCGRKAALLTSAGLYLLAYVCFLRVQSIQQILLGRFLQGCGAGFSITITPMYVGEIASAGRRGALGSILQIFMTLGMLLDYAIGPNVSFVQFQWIQMALPLVFVAGFIWMPDTPQFYASSGDQAKAAQALAFFRGVPVEDLGSEFGGITYSADESMRQPKRFYEMFRDHGNKRAFVICAGIVAFQQLSGINPVQFYAQTIFAKAETVIPADLSAVVIGCFQVLGSIITILIVDKVGRRPTLLTSTAGMCGALVALGAFFYLDENHPEVANQLSFIPVVSLTFYVFMFCTGLGPITWVLLGEMFALSVKSCASAIVNFIGWLVAFLTIFGFKSLDEILGIYWVFWIFASFCALAFVFAYVSVVETKGLTLSQIQARLKETVPLIVDRNDSLIAEDEF